MAEALLCGLIGAGIQQSRSPALHEREAKEQGLDLRYELIDMEISRAPLLDLLADAKKRGFKGLNITHPCKQAVIPLLDDLSPDARAINAVNTVVIRGGRTSGYNTDWSGFAESFRRGLPGLKLERVVQLGAGGAGAAVAHATRKLGVKELTIFDLDHSRAAALAGKVGAQAGADLVRAMAAADGLIHCTPTGMVGHPGLPLDVKLLEKRHWVAEIVYFPLETELLRAARAKGCRTLDGGGMVVFQAAAAFRLFTGREPDAERMLRHFRSM